MRDKKRIISSERDREATEQRLIDAIGELVAGAGFEHLGVNAVAQHSGVSKILIYRYFGSLDGLMAAYIRRHDFWINFPTELPAAEQLPAYLKATFRSQIAQLLRNPTLRRLYRWELSSDNAIVVGLREQREKVGLELVQKVARLAGRSDEQIAPLASLITAAVTYLALLGEFCPVFNGIRIDRNDGWELLARGIDELIDRMFPV